MYKSTHWTTLRPMYCSGNDSKGSKVNHHLYLLQQIEAKSFLKLNDQEGFNQDFD